MTIQEESGKEEQRQVVCFLSDGVLLSVATRPAPGAAPPCIVVNYDKRDGENDEASDMDAFEISLLGTTRAEFDQSAIYIW